MVWGHTTKIFTKIVCKVIPKVNVLGLRKLDSICQKQLTAASNKSTMFLFAGIIFSNAWYISKLLLEYPDCCM
ncbi:hypothetical protein BdWA1_002040 [Babesia duncani]|uniref:Uncharacterized protein n=1 Tax=Babesia duncani TaxID=323732 RepID=A0AAD9PLK3_9APIC|nr:hypothetical protein BdWA1_002040 [Babesia duncani]